MKVKSACMLMLALVAHVAVSTPTSATDRVLDVQRDSHFKLEDLALLQAGSSQPGTLTFSGLTLPFVVPLNEGQWWSAVESTNTGITECGAATCPSSKLSKVINGGVKECTVCTNLQYQDADCTVTSDRTCKPCTARNGDQYLTKPCDKTSDSKYEACTVCDVNGGFYESSPCTETSNRVCNKCVTRGDEQYRVSRCSATANAVYAPCTLTCRAGFYESTPCTEETNRVCTPCTTRTGDQYRTTTCAGSTDAVYQNCAAACSITQYEKTACTETTNRECVDCTARNGDQYRVVPCTTASNAVWKECATCSESQYETQACSETTNRVCASCTVRSGDQYLTRACTPTVDAQWTDCTPMCSTGFYESTPCTARSNRVCTACTARNGEQYRTTACSGSTDAVWVACTPSCGAGFYESTPCTETTNRVCTPCRARVGDQYRTTACTAATNAVWANCAICSSTQYETTPCTENTNRVCAACTTRNGEQYRTTTCSGSTDATYAACAPTCTSGTYQTIACTETTNRVCTPCTTRMGDQYRTTACTANTNAVWAACNTCSPNQYEITACTETTNRVCANCATRSGDQYRTTDCTSTTNAVYTPCSPSCAAGTYETTACTETTNRVCTACTARNGEQYRTTPCTATSNAVWAACKPACGAGFFESTPCTETTDRVCTACATRNGDQYLVTACTASANAVYAACTVCPAGSVETRGCTEASNRACSANLICAAPSIRYTSVNLPTNGGVTANKNTIYSKLPNTPSTGYCDVFLSDVRLHSNQRLCDGGVNSNFGQRFLVTFSEPSGNINWNFKISMDSGYGYIVYGDGVSIGQMAVDVWDGSTNPRTYTVPNVGAGVHTFEVYGGEGCCDGEAGEWQFQRGSGEWQVLSVQNLAKACSTVPRISYFSTQLTDAGLVANKDTIEARFLAGAAASGYCNKALTDLTLHSNQRLCPGGSNSNIGQRFQIAFEESGGGATWEFRINIDAGYGYSVFLDGTNVGQYVGDVWSGVTNPSTYRLENVALGPHVLVVYGGEGCCDGEAGAWTVSRNGEDFVVLNEANLSVFSTRVNPVPRLPTRLENRIRYFSTFLPANQMTVELNKNFIEAHSTSDLHGGNGYCTRQLTALSSHSNHGICPGGSSSSIGQKFAISFIEPAGDATWTFSIFMDSGYGYNVFFDNALVGSKSEDVWAGSTNPGVYTLKNVLPGVHTLYVYGGEGCCDGEAGTWTYTRNGGASTALTTAALDTVAKSSKIFYFSTQLPNNQGSTTANKNFIESKFRYRNNGVAGYCTLALDTLPTHANNQLCAGGSNSNIGQRFEVYFFESVGGASWDFRVFMDSGYGHVAFFDDVFLAERAGDVWDGATNPTIYSATVSAGFHRLVVYGGEGCCDGKAGDWQFQRNGAGFQALTTANLNSFGSRTS